MHRVIFAILLLIVIFNYSREENISKRQVGEITEDRWIWGFLNESTTETSLQNGPVDETTKITATTTEITTTTTTPRFSLTTTEPLPSFCLPYNNTKPNFAKPGRRIAAKKCLDYIYAMRVRLEEDKNVLKCIGYINKKYHIGAAIGGLNTKPGEYPHMGALGWKPAIGTWVFKCGSTLISENFVLTAAHCARAPKTDSSIADPIPKIVRLGDKNILDSKFWYNEPLDVKILKIIVHPEYKTPKQYFDIALVELQDKVKFSKFIQPACLSRASKPGAQAILTGWGVVQAGSLNISPELQAARVDMIDSKQCDDLLKPSCNRNWCGMQEHQLCAGKLAGGVDACQGDSGGPLQVKIPQNTTKQGQMHYVFGVISFGVGCAHPNLPGVYTRVSSFIDWIENIVWKDEIAS